MTEVPVLMGMETEYALAAVPRGGQDVSLTSVANRLLDLARQGYPSVPSQPGSGLFLATGGRLYVDIGSHPEYATPECTDPWELVRQVRAGDALLLELGRRLLARDPGLKDLAILRTNVDYSRTGATWGCHESYLHRLPSFLLPGQLMAHLVTRVLYTGAGGFHPEAPGLQFTLSPRAWHFTEAVSGSSTHGRGIFHAREEALSGHGWKRLHLICGDSTCSDLATLLKVGTTSLVVASVTAGLRPGNGIQLANPVAALHAVAADPTGQVELELESGRTTTPLALQRHYLDSVLSALARGCLPSWADAICTLWRRQLEAIETGGDAVARTLDWGIKRALYRRWASRHGFSWEKIAGWNQLLARVERALTGGAGAAAHSPDDDEVRPRLLPVTGFFNLRRELLEADLRFGQLGPGGIFAQLDQQGVLDHRVNGVGTGVWDGNLPGPGRARVRAQAICALWKRGASPEHSCDWPIIINTLTGDFLDLSDPFIEHAAWSAQPQPVPLESL